VDLARSVATALAIALVLGTCGPLSTERSAGPAPGDAATLREIERTWRYLSDHAGGYEDLGDLSAPPSLYATSWSLRLASWYGLATPNLSTTEVAVWLEGAADSELATAEIASRLMRWNLAAHALSVLGRRPSREHIRDVLEIHQRGPLYAPDDREPASWAATLWAVQLMSLSALDVPQATIDTLRAALPQLTVTATDENSLNTLLPAWTLATQLVEPSDRAALREPLRAALLRLHQRATSTPTPDAVSIGVLYQIDDIARANGIVLPGVPAEMIRALQSPSGYLTFAPGQPAPEPQATFHAARLGMPLSPRLAELLAIRAGPNGWRNTTADVTPAATYHSLAVARALRHSGREASLRAMTELWLRRLQPPAKLDLTREGRELFFTLLLARTLGLTTEPSYVNALRERLESEATAVNTPRIRSLAWLVRIAQVLDLTVSDATRERLSRIAVDATAKATKLDTAYYGSLIARFVGTTHALDAAHGLALALRAPDGTFRESSDARLPDLQSTCAGVELTKTPAASAAEPFMTNAGAVMQPVNSSLSRWHSVETVFFGLVVAGRADDRYALCYQ